MQYEIRLRFINYIKNNFSVKNKEIIVFHYDDFVSLNLISAEKILDSNQMIEYHKKRADKNLGYCFLYGDNTDGPFIEFNDFFLIYEEYFKIKFCMNNSLNTQLKVTRSEVIIDTEQLVRQLNGEEPLYRKSDC